MSINAVAFIRRHGVVLESAKGPVPNLADAVAGTSIRGSWWKHRDSKKIFQVTRQVRNSKHVLVCRLVGGKVTYVHSRLWPAIVRLAGSLKTKDLAAIREEHSASGEHQLKQVPFPKWVPAPVRQHAKAMSETQAAKQLGGWATGLLRRT